MGNKGRVVETHIDRLLHILENKKHVAVSEIAKELSVSADVVEEWGRLLEEDNIVRIKYQLTKPYLELLNHTALQGTVSDKKVKLKPEHTESIKKNPALTQTEIITPPIILPPKNELHLSVKDKEKKYSEILKRNPQKIGILIKEGYGHMRKGNIPKAIQSYNVIKALYEELPNGSYSVRAFVTDKMVTFYQDLLVAQTNALTRQTKATMNSLLEKLQASKNSLDEKNHAKSQTFYDEAKQMMSDLPDGFLEEKVKIQEQLLLAYKELLHAKKNAAQLSVTKKTLEINDTIMIMLEYIERGDIESASQEYKKIHSTYQTLPKGFIHHEVTLKHTILNAYKTLVNAQHTHSNVKMSTATKKIETHLKGLDYSLAKNSKDLAITHFTHAVQTYNTLSPGYDDRKSQLRSLILERYPKLMQRADVAEIEDADPYVKNKYQVLMNAIIEVYEAIDAKNFEHLDSSMAFIETAYQELPLKMLSNRTTIGKEVETLKSLLELYKKSKTSVTIADKEDVLHKVSELKNIAPLAKNILFEIELAARQQLYSKREDTSPLIQKKRTEAMSALSNNDFTAALPHIETWLTLDPQNLEARSLLEAARREMKNANA